MRPSYSQGAGDQAPPQHMPFQAYGGPGQGSQGSGGMYGSQKGPQYGPGQKHYDMSMREGYNTAQTGITTRKTY